MGGTAAAHPFNRFPETLDRHVSLVEFKPALVKHPFLVYTQVETDVLNDVPCNEEPKMLNRPNALTQ